MRSRGLTTILRREKGMNEFGRGGRLLSPSLPILCTLSRPAGMEKGGGWNGVGCESLTGGCWPGPQRVKKSTTTQGGGRGKRVQCPDAGSHSLRPI